MTTYKWFLRKWHNIYTEQELSIQKKKKKNFHLTIKQADMGHWIPKIWSFVYLGTESFHKIILKVFGSSVHLHNTTVKY